MALFPLFTHSSSSDTLNFHCLPILLAGMPSFLFRIHPRSVTGLIPRYSAASSMLIHLSLMLSVISSSSLCFQIDTINRYQYISILQIFQVLCCYLFIFVYHFPLFVSANIFSKSFYLSRTRLCPAFYPFGLNLLSH